MTSERPPGAGDDAPDRIWTIPNALSLLRLLGVPLFLYLVLVAHADVAALILLVAAGVSDYLDGYLARRLNQRSRVGVLLDPLADRLYIAATIIGLAVRGFIPWWLVVVLAARDLMLLALMPMLRRQHRFAVPVTTLGKAATFALLWGFPFLLISQQPAPLGPVAFALGWAFALWGTYMYWWSGIEYVRDVLGYSSQHRLPDGQTRSVEG